MANCDVTVTQPPGAVTVPTLAQRTEDEARHLRAEHQLTPVVAWVKASVGSGEGERTRSTSASRMARSRARKAEAGLISCYVPALIVEEVKAAGGWDAWRAQASATRPSSDGSSMPPFRRAETGFRALCVRLLIRLIQLIQYGDAPSGAAASHQEETSC